MDDIGMQYACFLHRQHVPLILGTDSGVMGYALGFSVHRELALLNQSGLSPMDAPQTATINAARFLGIEKTSGSIAVSKVSDLVLLDEKPLVDIANTRKIRGVMVGRPWFDREALDQVLARLKK